MPQKQRDIIINNYNKAWIVKTDGTIEVATHGDGERFTLEELQSMVDGYIERHKLFRGLDEERNMLYTIMVLNEDARMKGLPINNAAVSLWSYIKGYPIDLFGDVVVMPAKLFPK